MDDAIFRKKYVKIWNLAVPLLRKGRPDDFMHAKNVLSFIQKYNGPIKIDKSILIPTAILHDIGHSGLMPGHMHYIVGPKKIINSKLVHMLVGAKIAFNLLNKVKYPTTKIKEIIDIISIHDMEQMDIDWQKLYNSKNKKIFHDIDLLDFYDQKRLAGMRRTWSKKKLGRELNRRIDNFFYIIFRKMAERNLKLFV